MQHAYTPRKQYAATCAVKIDYSNSFNGRAGGAGSVMVTMLADTTERYSAGTFADINKGLNDEGSAGSSTQQGL